MIRGLPASILLHAAVIGAGYVVWPYVASTATESEFVIVPVELVDVGEMTNVAPILEPEAPDEEDDNMADNRHGRPKRHRHNRPVQLTRSASPAKCLSEQTTCASRSC